MIIKSVRVKRFRSVLDETLNCDSLTALVGPNGSGKSAFVRSLDLFYAPEPRVSLEDFYADDPSQPIEIAVTFSDLSTEAQQHFDKYIENGTVTVERVFSQNGTTVSAKYHGSTLQNPDFASVRDATSATDKKAAYQQVKARAAYGALPNWQNQTQGLQALRDWEAANEQSCQRMRDDGQFFGFKEVAQGYLGRYTRFILIPAVRDAGEDAAEGKGSPITELMDLVVRSALASRQDLLDLRQEIQTRYESILDPERLAELGTLGDLLTTTLRAYVPEAAVALSWIKGGAIEIPLPKALVKLVEDGYHASVARTGHGLQRAFILTLLQHLAVARKLPAGPRGAEEPPAGGPEGAAPIIAPPDLVLGIEEPELYQHPNRQRHIAKILLQLASGTIPGVAGKTQIVYATHSPLFVGTDRFDQIRIARKVDGEAGRPRKTKLIWTTLDRLAEELWTLAGQQGARFTGETLRARLQAIMTPWMNEGFFADVAVLVEGEDDRAAILGTAAAMGHDLERDGFAIIPCMGKSNLDRPTLIFRRLSIPTYVVWDSDEGEQNARPEENCRLLRLMNHAEEDWPSKLEANFACFGRNLETTLRDEITADVYDRLLSAIQAEWGITRKAQATKNPSVVQELLRRAQAEGRTSPTLRSIVERILALKPRREAA